VAAGIEWQAENPPDSHATVVDYPKRSGIPSIGGGGIYFTIFVKYYPKHKQNRNGFCSACPGRLNSGVKAEKPIAKKWRIGFSLRFYSPKQYF
jgi:hypothetical protein